MLEILHLNDTELAYCLAINKLYPSSSKVRKIIKLLDIYGSFGNIWQLNHNELASNMLFSEKFVRNYTIAKNNINPEGLLKQHFQENNHIYHYFNQDYPNQLRQIHNPPLILFCNRPIIQTDFDNTLAIVGTRQPSNYGQNMAKLFAQDLIAHNLTIVSGMANGIDSICHKCVIDNQGKTIGVLGNSLNICYPANQIALYRQMLTSQLLISEYPLTTLPKPFQFPERNRIIAGLAMGTLVIEAPAKSGSLITAKLAFEQNRQVFAVPGNVDNDLATGTNLLIAKNIAKLVNSARDILEELNMEMNIQSAKISGINHLNLSSEELEVLNCLNDQALHFDSLCHKLGLNSAKLASLLTILEINGFVDKLPGNNYQIHY